MSISEKISRLGAARDEIRQAINSQGGSLSAESGFESFAQAVSGLCTQEALQLYSGELTANGQYIESLEIELGFRPLAFIIFGNGITSESRIFPQAIVSAFCIDLPDTPPATSVCFVSRSSTGIAQAYTQTGLNGLSFSDSGVRGFGQNQLFLQNGKKYKYYAIYK